MSATSKTITGLNVRAAPEVTPTNTIETLSSGEPFTAVGNVNKWLHIEHNGKQGFVNGDFTTALEPTVAAPLWTTNVTSDGLNLRDSPSMQGTVVGTLAKGDQ